MNDEKIIKPDEEWKEELSPEQFRVMREKKPKRRLPACWLIRIKMKCSIARPAAIRFFISRRNLNPVRAGRASMMRFREVWRFLMTIVTECSGLKFCAPVAARTWDIFFMMRPISRPATVFASMQLVWEIKRRKTCEFFVLSRFILWRARDRLQAAEQFYGLVSSHPAACPEPAQRDRGLMKKIKCKRPNYISFLRHRIIASTLLL